VERSEREGIRASGVLGRAPLGAEVVEEPLPERAVVQVPSPVILPPRKSAPPGGPRVARVR